MMPVLPDWPMFGLDDDPRPALRACKDAGQIAALATIVALDGGGPRPIGTQMVLSESVLSGFLSGGCLEADVAVHAAAVTADGHPRRLVYGAGSPWPDIRLLCGARIEVLLEAITPGDGAVAELLASDTNRSATRWISDGRVRRCGPAVEPWAGAFLKRFEPTMRLLVLGSDPIALAVARLGVHAGWQVTLVRTRGPSRPPPIAGLNYRRDTAAEALAALVMDPWTAIVVATHDVDADHEALVAALPSAAFYVGALGARRRLPERKAALLRAGVGGADLSRLRAPIGLDTGGKAPWEIAIATIGEITAVRQSRAEK